MLLEKKVYNIPVVTNDSGHSLIDMSLIKLMLYVESFGFNAKKEQEEKEKQISVIDFKSKLNYIFNSCLMQGSYPWQNPNAIIGEAPGFDICFNKEKIELSKKYIAALLNEVGDISYFTDLSILKNGQVWTELKQDIQKLLALASAAGIIDYYNNHFNMYDNNPEILIKR